MTDSKVIDVCTCISFPRPVVPRSSIPATSEAKRMQRVQWIHRVMIVFINGPISLSSTALKYKHRQMGQMCKNSWLITYQTVVTNTQKPPSFGYIFTYYSTKYQSCMVKVPAIGHYLVPAHSSPQVQS
jgi:hypothetical protein